MIDPEYLALSYGPHRDQVQAGDRLRMIDHGTPGTETDTEVVVVEVDPFGDGTGPRVAVVSGPWPWKRDHAVVFAWRYLARENAR